ncbi:MAG: ABC transporter [Opitutus sp.]|nr:ABC transporter [Opitutus sp.]
MGTFDSFRATRWLRTFNLVLQAVLFLSFFAGLNYVARNHVWRFDLTRQRKFSLSAETLSYIKNLQRPVHLVATLTEEHDNPEVRGLLDEYTYATAGNARGRITREYIDVYQNRRRAEELGIDQSDLIVVISGEKQRRSLPVDELYVVKNKQREAFRGEQALTAAVLDVTSSEQQKIYFLVGHGELQPTDTDAVRGLSVLREQLRLRNFQVDTIDLSVARRVPADASLLVAVDPSPNRSNSSYTRPEQELLRQYLSTRAGRLILLLAPGQSADRLGLADLLLDWGVLVDDDLVVDPDPANVTDDADLMISAYDPTHPIVQTVLSYHFPLRLGATRTVRPDPGRSTASGLTVVPVAATSKTAWGETNYRRLPAVRDPNDIRPIPGIPPRDQLGVVVASERVSVRDNLPFSVPGGRLVVFGSGDLVSNRRITNNGNLPVFLGAVNWSVDRDRQLTIAPRPIERFQLALSSTQFLRLRYTLLLALPGAALLLGLIVYWIRRV